MWIKKSQGEVYEIIWRQKGYGKMWSNYIIILKVKEKYLKENKRNHQSNMLSLLLKENGAGRQEVK